MLQRSKDRQESERRGEMCQGQHDSERNVEESADPLMGDVNELQQCVHYAVAAKDCLPCIRAYEVAHPKWNDDQLEQQVFVPGAERQVVSDRISEQECKQGDRSRDLH